MTTNKAPIGAIVVCVILFILLIASCGVGYPAYGRYQSRQDRQQNRTQARLDAQNRVSVNNINIGFFQQQLKIAQQQASIRQAQAVGIREAQDKISSTLTPLYVQFEMTEALKQIAESGKNSSVIYIPTNPATGLPQVAPVTSTTGK